MYTLEWTPSFIRAAKSFAKRHPELKKEAAIALLALEQNPLQPSLKLHALEGKLKGMHTISITYSYRIILTLKISEHEVTLLNIGDHDDVY